ncbi:MAG: hypothetical protein GWP61_29285 [Chloroflexi bacterium]|jgi:hypothetical protein|nr:hypothetical protein [Chloroflexota bacterium]
MQANATGIRQNFADVRLRWDKAKLKKSRVFWIAIGAIVLTLFLGFSRGGWTTGGSAEEMAEKSAQSAVVARLAPICVAQFNADGQGAVKLAELKAIGSSRNRTAYVTEQGWATMPGETAPVRQVAAACANQLMLIGE